MGGFLGNIIGRILSRIIMMGIMVGGGQYYLSQNGGLSGLFGGGGAGASGGLSQPISAGFGGLGAIASSLGIGSGDGGSLYTAQGRISAIREECRLAKGRTRTDPLPCARAHRALTYPQFDGYRVEEMRVATYIYYDPNGIDVLTGKTDAERGHRVGDVLDLRIDRNNPRRSTPI